MDRRRKPKAAKARARRPRVRKAPKGAGTNARDLETSLEREKATGALLQENTRALTEALDQQTATAEILRDQRLAKRRRTGVLRHNLVRLRLATVRFA